MMAFSIKKVFRIPGYFLGVYFKIGLKRREGTKVLGVTNKIGSDYVLFLDYDINDILMLEDEIKSLQRKNDLSTAYIFETGRGFHVIIPDLLTYQEVKHIMSQATIEYAYFNVPQNNKKKVWVLRLTDKKNSKITFYGKIYNESMRKTSYPHLKLLMDRGIKVVASQLLNSSYEDNKLQYAAYEA